MAALDGGGKPVANQRTYKVLICPGPEEPPMRNSAPTPRLTCIAPKTSMTVPDDADATITPSTTPKARRVSSTHSSTCSSSATCDCPICLSPVSMRSTSSRRAAGRRTGFRTQCCGKIFHLQCLQEHKGTSVLRACPLCRSEQPTGLTPARRVTGFVEQSSNLETRAMLMRVSSARRAVQMRLANR